MIDVSRRSLMMATAAVLAPRMALAADAVKIKRQYADCRYGQLHMQVAQPA